MGTHFKGQEQQRVALDTMIKLVRATETVLAATKKVYSDADLSESQFGVLEALWHLGPMSQNQLAKKILKSKGNMTLVIDNLKKRKLIICTPQVGDKRFLLIQLSKEGKALIQQLFPAHAMIVTKTLSTLSVEEQTSLGALCKKLGLSNQ